MIRILIVEDEITIARLIDQRVRLRMHLRI